MATIPLHVGQRRLDTGNVVSYPEGSPVGRAIQGFGDELSAVAERYQQMKDQQEAFDGELARRRFGGQIAQAEDEVAAKASADGSGLHDAMYGQVDPRTGTVVKPGLFDAMFDNTLPNMPESQRANFARQKEPMRGAGSLRMAGRQLQRRDDYEMAEWAKVDNMSTSAIAKSDPNDTATFEAIRQSGLDLIAKIGNPAARQVAEAAWRTNTAKARMEALIAQDPRRAAEMLSASPVASDGMGETVRAQLAAGARDGRAAAKAGRIKKSPDRMVAQAFEERSTEANAKADADGSHQFITDMTGEQIDDLFRRASVANTANMINTRADIERATLNAPRELMYRGTYSDKLPGEGDFDHVYAAEEGAKQRTSFIRKIKIGRAAFELLPLPNDALEAIAAEAQSDAESAANQPGSQENFAASAAKQILQERRDPARFLSLADPNSADAWNAWANHTSGDSVALRRALALSVAGQKQLHVPEILPFPQDVLRYINRRLSDPNGSLKDKDALVDELSSATDDPVVQAAMFRQLYHFGLARLVRNTALELQMTPVETQAAELEQAANSDLHAKGEVWSYDPTLREKAGGFIAGEGRPYGLRADLARALVGSSGLGNEGISVADVAPVIGGVFSSQEALRALEAGHYGEAALDAVGVMPSVGLGGKVGKKVVGEVAEEIFGKAAKDAVSLAKQEEEFASRSVNIYDPSPKPTRSIFDDYKGAVKADDNEKLLIDARTGRYLSDPETGRLLYDPEGRALGERVVGRRMVGGEDVAILPEEYDAIAKAGTGKGYTPVEAGAFPKGVVGKYVVARGPEGPERRIYILKTLRASDATKVGAHEIGHLIDDLAGKIVTHDRVAPVRMIDQEGIKGELKWLYNDLNNPHLQRERARGVPVEQFSSKIYQGFVPEQVGYKKGIDTDRELMAEAIRAYMANPNYMKTVAPKTAARIREYVNANKDLRGIIQFNSVIGIGGGGAGAAAVLGTQNDSATQGESEL